MSLNGTKVRITESYHGYSDSMRQALIGRTGTIVTDEPDSEGDVRITMDDRSEPCTGETYYVRGWVVLADEINYTSAGEIRDGEHVEHVEQTPAERRLERLIDAIYEGADEHGYRGYLVEIFRKADVPMRDTQRVIRFRGAREVSVDREPVKVAMATYNSTQAEVDIVGVQALYCVTLPWPVTDLSVHDCDQVNARLQEGSAEVPEGILVGLSSAVGGHSTVAGARAMINSMGTRESRFGLAVSCTLCN